MFNKLFNLCLINYLINYLILLPAQALANRTAALESAVGALEACFCYGVVHFPLPLFSDAQ